jgi:hypothetical protein
MESVALGRNGHLLATAILNSDTTTYLWDLGARA